MDRYRMIGDIGDIDSALCRDCGSIVHLDHITAHNDLHVIAIATLIEPADIIAMFDFVVDEEHDGYDKSEEFD